MSVLRHRPAAGKPVQKRMGAKLLEMAPPKTIDKAKDQIAIFPVELWEGFPAAENRLDGGGQAGETA